MAKRRCGICGELGHNSRTCNSAMGERPSEPEVSVEPKKRRRCGKCGLYGHNSRTCGSLEASPEKHSRVKPVATPKLTSVSFRTIHTEEGVLTRGDVGNKNYLVPPLRDLINELLELISIGEGSPPTRTQELQLDDYRAKKKPSKVLVMELKGQIDPHELTFERYTLKSSLRERGFRIPKGISTPELVQLAIRREVLDGNH